CAVSIFFFFVLRRPPISTLFPYTTLFRSLLLLDSAGKTIGRNITNDRGLYRIALAPEIRRMRVLRLGFRPREVRVPPTAVGGTRSEEHTSELQSRFDLVCRLLLEKKKKQE